MVRLWSAEGEEGASGLHGTAQHLRSGRRIAFSESDALLEFLSTAVPEDRDPEAARADDDE